VKLKKYKKWNCQKKQINHFLKVNKEAVVVVRDIGHGTQGDLELLQEDLSDEGFKVITFS